MSKMVERVAQVLAEKMNGGMFNSPQFYNGEQRELWLERARAAIEAMREPADAMRADGRDAIQPYLVGGRVAKPVPHQWHIADETWRAMIDAALR